MVKSFLESKYLLIVDYNLSRVEDVRMLSQYAASKYKLKTALIRLNPRPVDFEIADLVFDLDPLDRNFLGNAIEALKEIQSDIVVALPFSDNAVQVGAALASALGLKADCPHLAEAAFSKLTYRRSETQLREIFRAQGIDAPGFRPVYAIEDLSAALKSFRGEFILKPSCEGNNRGVLRVQEGDSLAKAFEAVRPYLSGGAIAEELIRFPEEYSFDGVDGLHFITKKNSASGKFPVERGQTVGARIPASIVDLVKRAGTLANMICGQRFGPFHNEIKVDMGKMRAAVMEPNRRPAGMKIWHLAEKVYGLNFFHLWVDQMIHGEIPRSLPAPQGAAGIRMLGVPTDGIYNLSIEQGQICHALIQQKISKETKGIEFFRFDLNEFKNRSLQSVPEDNSGFVAEVCAFSRQGAATLDEALDLYEREWLQLMSDYRLSAPQTMEASL